MEYRWWQWYMSHLWPPSLNQYGKLSIVQAWLLLHVHQLFFNKILIIRNSNTLVVVAPPDPTRPATITAKLKPAVNITEAMQAFSASGWRQLHWLISPRYWFHRLSNTRDKEKHDGSISSWWELIIFLLLTCPEGWSLMGL